MAWLSPDRFHGSARRLAAVITLPSIVRRTVLTSPLPPQSPQRDGWLPGAAPEPSQFEHSTSVGISTSRSTPVAASSSVTTTSARTSGPLVEVPRSPTSTEERREQIRDAADVTEIAEALAPGAASSPKSVVLLSLPRVGQHVVRVGDLFEPLLGDGVARVRVRMVLASELAIGALYLFLSCVSATPRTS